MRCLLKERSALSVQKQRVRCSFESKKSAVLSRARNVLSYRRRVKRCTFEGQKCVVLSRASKALYFRRREVRCTFEGEKCVVLSGARRRVASKVKRPGSRPVIYCQATQSRFGLAQQHQASEKFDANLKNI